MGRILFHPQIRIVEAARIAREQRGRLVRSGRGVWGIDKLSVPGPVPVTARDFYPVIVPCAGR